MRGVFDFWEKEKEVFSEKSDGRRITITQRGNVRTLRCDGIIFSRIDGSSLYTHEYWDFFMPLAYLYDRPEILMIGLGGGTIAYQLSRLLGERFSLDIIESDRLMAEIYPRFLGASVNCRITIGDGAEYVSANRAKYDILILDAYDSRGRIPSHFLEKAFVADAFECIKPKGIFAINCIGSMLGPDLDSFLQNLSEKFQVYRIDTSGYTANVVLVCTRETTKDELLEALHSRMKIDRGNEFLMRAYDLSKRLFLTT